MSGPMDAVGLTALYRDFAKPHKVVPKDEVRTCFRLCELSWYYQVLKARHVVEQAEGRPVLYSYGSDSTPMLTTSTVSSPSPIAGKIVRKAGRGLEYLLERAFVVTTNGSGELLKAALFKPPTPLDKGKGAWQCFSASCDFFPMLRRLGHRGIAISHYVFDRALFGSLQTKQKQKHALYYELAGGEEGKSGEVALADLQDWVIATGCANHDSQNALKWSLVGHSQEGEVITKLHVSIESLRNAYNHLHSHLNAFVCSSLCFVDAAHDPSEVYQFWIDLGVESGVAELLAELNLQWEPSSGQLQVHASQASREDLTEAISGVILTLLRFKKFTDSRWTTVGDSCRSLVAALHVGLDGLVRTARKDPETSDYHLHGIVQLDASARRYATIAAMCARVPDAALLELLQDDRLALRVDIVESAVKDEMDWLSRVQPFTWARLSSFLEDASPQSLRSDVLMAGHVASAFISRKFLAPAKEYPWRLARGDVSANITALADAADVKDETTAKIQQLARLGFNRAMLIQGVERLANVGWTTTVVEQGHGSAATIHRVHRQYGANMLSARSMVHMTRSLLPVAEEGSLKSRSAEKRLHALSKRSPGKVTGRHIFFADCVAASEASLQDGESMPLQQRHSLMKSHAHMYKQLSRPQQAHYESRAEDHRNQMRHELEEQVASCTALLTVSDKSLGQSLEEAHQLRLSDCRLSQEDMASMAVLWESPAFSHRAVTELRAKHMESPGPPPAHLQAQLEDIEVEGEGLDALPVAEWCRLVCRNRAALSNTCLVFRTGAEERHYVLLYAVQRPFLTALLPVERVYPTLPAVANCSKDTILKAMSARFDFEFRLTGGPYLHQDDLEVAEGTEVFVLPGLVFTDNGLASHGQLFPLLEFKDSSAKGGGAQAHPRSRSQPIADADLLERFPWLAAYMPDKVKAGPKAVTQRASSSQGAGTHPESQDLSEEQTEALFSVLGRKRKEWQTTYDAPPEDFKTCVRGGTRQQKQKGVVVDHVQASAATPLASEWVEMYGMQKTASFSIHVYGERGAAELSLLSCRRMQFFYERELHCGALEYEYNAEDVANAPCFDESTLASLNLNPKARARAHEVMQLHPRALATKGGSRSSTG